VVIKHPDGTDEILPVHGVRGVLATDRDAVARELADADLAATAVGAGALRSVAALVRDGLARRMEQRPGSPLDVILAENVRDAASVVGDIVGTGPMVGLVQTSIGKMVPIVPAETVERDPLLVFAEPYNTLIVDARGFRGPVPDLPEIKAVEHIDAWVDRKLFLHNLGHAAVAYFGYRTAPEARTIAEAVTVPEVLAGARNAMTQSAAALAAAYPESLAERDLIEHRDDLLTRFANRALGDTVFRVGRDLKRKLARDDRIVGAMLLAANHGVPFDAIARVYAAAVEFGATDESGRVHPGDDEVTREYRERGVDAILRDVSGLNPDVDPDRRIVGAVREAIG